MRKIFITTLLAAGSLMFTQCTKPSEGFTISINPDVFDNVVSVKFYDAATPGVAPTGVKLTITGPQAQSIYEISGYRIFNVVDGIISLGLLPAAAPTDGNPAVFVINAEADGYLPVRVPVTILQGQASKLVSISMVNIDNPPPGVTVVKKSTTLTGNAIGTTETIATPGTGVSTSVELPSGTTFSNAGGSQITGTTLNTVIANFSTDEAASLNAFPGNGFHSDDITDENSNTVSGIFRTAGFCHIGMELGGTEVRTFSQPVTVTMGIRNNQMNPRTGAAFAAGDEIPVWSYQIETGQWRYEKQGTVTDNGGNLEVAFTTTHLTYYNLAYLDNVCASSQATIVTGLPAAESFLVDIFAAGDNTIPAIGGYIVQVANNGLAAFENVPQGTVTLKIYRNTAANSQTDWKVRDGAPLATYTGTLCGNQPVITLNMPSLTPILFDIEGKCPNNSANPYVRPSVDIWYRLKNIGEYQLLGHVEQGKFETTNLNYESNYDFKVVWGGSKVFLRSKYIDSTSYTRTIVVPESHQQNFCQ